MKRINQLPKGYMYPELHAQTSMPEELDSALARKNILDALNNPREKPNDEKEDRDDE